MIVVYYYKATKMAIAIKLSTKLLPKYIFKCDTMVSLKCPSCATTLVYDQFVLVSDNNIYWMQ